MNSFSNSLEIEENSFIPGILSHFWKDFALYESFFKFHWKLKRNPSFMDFSFLKDFPLYEFLFKFIRNEENSFIPGILSHF